MTMSIQKTEIDKAPYIAYADKPGTIYDGSGGGGGGVACFEIAFGDVSITANFSYNDLIEAISGNQFVIAIAENMPATPPSTDVGYGVFILYFAGTDGSGYSASFISGSNMTMPFTSSDPDAVMEYTI